MCRKRLLLTQIKYLNSFNLFRCTSGECLDEAKRCDGHFDCADHSDERDCDTDSKEAPVMCSYNEFPCADKTQCIDQNLRCDMNHDCNDKSDELNCSHSSKFYMFF